MSWHNQFIKIPFADRGRTIKGADCWGLSRIIYDAMLGIDLPILDDYESTLDKEAIDKIIRKEMIDWQNVPKGEEIPYDIAVFNMLGQPMHIGVVVRSGYMIHCQRGAGTTFESYDSHRWRNRIEGFCRYAKYTNNPSTL